MSQAFSLFIFWSSTSKTGLLSVPHYCLDKKKKKKSSMDNDPPTEQEDPLRSIDNLRNELKNVLITNLYVG